MKKQINLSILFLVLALSSACAPKPQPDGGESCPQGASSEPLSDVLLVDTDGNNLLEINNEADLRQIRYDMKGSGCTAGTDDACLGYELKSDITLSKDWTPVGGRPVLDASIQNLNDCKAEGGIWEGESKECLVATSFGGTFDGGGYSIRKLKIRATGLRYVGFFGRVRGEDAVIKNLRFIGGSVESSYSSFDEDGDGEINDTKVNDFASEATTWIGAVVGSLEDARMEGVSSDISVKVSTRCEPFVGDSRIGGLVGQVSLQTGAANPTMVSSSFATGNVSGGSGDDYAGGLIGGHGLSAVLEGVSYATGNVSGGSGKDRVGGLIGNVVGGAGGTRAFVSSSYATGNVDGGLDEDQVGGLIGAMDTANLYSGYIHTGTVSGGSGDDQVGGLVGELRGSNLENSYASSNTNGDAGDDQVGGLIGANGSLSLVRNSYATGDVDGGTEDDSVGGLVGQNYTVSESEGRALLYSVGGIVNSYATGNVDGGEGPEDKVGPLVGDNTTPEGTTQDGRTIPSSYGSTSSSYYNSASTLSGETENSLGTGKSSLALRVQTEEDSTATDQNDCVIALGGTLDTNVCTNDHFEGWNGASFADWDFGTAAQFPTLKSYKFTFDEFCSGGTADHGGVSVSAADFTTQEGCVAVSTFRWTRGEAITREEGDILCGQPGTRVACTTN